MERFNAVLNLLSVVVIIFAATMLVPLALSLHLADGAEQAYDTAVEQVDGRNDFNSLFGDFSLGRLHR